MQPQHRKEATAGYGQAEGRLSYKLFCPPLGPLLLAVDRVRPLSSFRHPTTQSLKSVIFSNLIVVHPPLPTPTPTNSGFLTRPLGLQLVIGLLRKVSWRQRPRPPGMGGVRKPPPIFHICFWCLIVLRGCNSPAPRRLVFQSARAEWALSGFLLSDKRLLCSANYSDKHRNQA